MRRAGWSLAHEQGIGGLFVRGRGRGCGAIVSGMRSGTAAAAGIAAGAVVLGVAELLAGVLIPDAAPLRLLGDAVVDHAPKPVREWAIETFGTADKPVLVGSMLTVAVLVAALAGLLERRRPLGSALFALLAAGVAVLAVVRAGWFGVLPIMLGACCGIAVLCWAVNAADQRAGSSPGADDSQEGAGTRTGGREGAAAEPAAEESGRAGGDAARTAAKPRTAPDPGRRRVLRGLALAAGIGVAAGLAGRALGALRRDVSGERAAITLPPPREPLPATPPGADLRVPGLTPYLTANTEFYRIDTALTVPQVSIEDWSLRIHGLVAREITLTWADLAGRPAVERIVTLACVSNPVGGDLVGNARWLGYRLDELLAEAGPLPEADMVLSRSADGWTAGTPLAALTDGRDALLAVGMNGEPLPVRHGYPARLVVPGLYGYVSATKWVTELEITRFDRAKAYWTRRGWAERGPIKTATRIDTPGASARLEAGSVPIAGVAWAQHRGILGVEVQIDGGPWRPARLAADVSADTWRQWVFDWDATPGPHTIRARATDGTGAVQTEQMAPAVPDGASGYPSVLVRVD